MNVQKICRLSMLTAIALIIFVVELRIPNLAPVAGMKLGLANIVTVYALYHFTVKETAMILFIRILLGSLFSGNVSALIFSLSGGLFCLVGMSIIYRLIDEKHIWICSVLGAVLHNIGQLFAASVYMKTASVWAYLPILTVSGCIAGLFTGLCAQMLIKRVAIDKVYK